MHVDLCLSIITNLDMQHYIETFLLILSVLLSGVKLISFKSACLSESEENSNTVFEQVCCKTSNIGKNIKLIDGKKISLSFCPDSVPHFCNLSCTAIHQLYPSAPSGYYNITITPDYGSKETVYCDMEGVNCGGEGGWTRIANLNMTVPGTSCPEGLAQLSFDNANSDLCGRDTPYFDGCNSTVFQTFGLTFTKVCGRVRGYQYGATQAFSLEKKDLNLEYLDGVSITCGSPRHHVWSYATGWSNYCPCNNDPVLPTPPSFIGSDYYCETAVIANSLSTYALFPNDPLWDGLQCDSNEATDEAPCCTDPKLPWFVKELKESVTQDIELRVCVIHGNTLLEIIELYVK